MRQVKTADLKAHLSAYLAAVRAGETIIVCDRNTPIARLEPIEQRRSGLVIHPATRSPRSLDEIQPVPLLVPTDVVAMLIESRD